jgi:threonyl-tRNA synthetase
MRLLVLHVDRFEYTITEPTRSPLREPVAHASHTVSEALVALASVEREDEAAPARVAQLAAEELARLARQLGVRQLVLHPFAHLFGTVAAPAVAREVLDAVREGLQGAGFEVHRSPFGWFTRWNLQTKGHPLSRVGRIVRATPADAPASGS